MWLLEQKISKWKAIWKLLSFFFWILLTILILCPFECPAQMFCFGKKICSRFWWLKISLHLSTSKILIASVRSINLLKKKMSVNIAMKNKNGFCPQKKRQRWWWTTIPLDTINEICTVHSHIPGMWQSIYDWPNFVQILDTLVNMTCQFVYLFPSLCLISVKPAIDIRYGVLMEEGTRERERKKKRKREFIP